MTKPKQTGRPLIIPIGATIRSFVDQARAKDENHKPLISEQPLELLNKSYPQHLKSNLVKNLDELLIEEDFINYLFRSNTFFHGRVGFYKHVIDKINILRNRKTKAERYVNTQKDLDNIDVSKAKKRTPIILLPITETENALNTLVANSFEKSHFIWLIAPPTVLHSHLLAAFNNFFLSNNTGAELKHLQQIFPLPDSTMRMLDEGTYKGIVVTDYKPLSLQTNSNIVTIIRLQNL